VRTGGVVMLSVFLKHGAQVSLTDDEHPECCLLRIHMAELTGVLLTGSSTATRLNG
jgi:hypothetical protein